MVGLVAGAFLPMAAQEPVLAQDSTATPAGAESTVQIFVVICETSAVINLSGVMQSGYDVYYQIFNGPNGTGTAITGLRRVQVNGSYAVSEVINYNTGSTIPAGSGGSAYVAIASESNSNNTIFTTTVNDAQDGCASPQNPTVSSGDVGGTSSSSTTSSGAILTPGGGVLDTPGTAAEPLVVVGARRSDLQERTDNPGLIFAECDQYVDRADPGLIYDTDNVRIFWSWYARTEAQLQDHLNTSIYEITFNRAPLIPVDVTIEQRDGLYWLFYVTPIGNLAPGNYGVEFKLSWSDVISDGFDDYGPGTGNDRFNSTCTFTVVQNPDRTQSVSYNLMYSVR